MGKHDHDWSKRRPESRMRYESAAPMTFAMGGDEYAEGWDRIFGKKKAEDQPNTDTSAVSSSEGSTSGM